MRALHPNMFAQDVFSLHSGHTNVSPHSFVSGSFLMRIFARRIFAAQVGEREEIYGLQDWPLVYILGSTLTLDLACVTKYCRIFSALPNATLRDFSSLGALAGKKTGPIRVYRIALWLEGFGCS